MACWISGCPRPGGGSPVTTVTLPGGGQPALRWRLLLRMQAFEFERCAITDAAVQAAYVVPALQEGEDAPPGLIMGIEVFAHEQLGEDIDARPVCCAAQPRGRPI